MIYPLAFSTWGKEEVEAIQKVIDTDMYTMGKHVKQFEQEFAKLFGSEYAVMVNSGSSANLFINSSTGFLARSTSDRRGKKDISDIVSTLEQLCQLRPIYFYNKNDESNEIRLAGLIADEVEGIFPDLVPEKIEAEEIYRSVAYDRLGVYIINAIKEIKSKEFSLCFLF